MNPSAWSLFAYAGVLVLLAALPPLAPRARAVAVALALAAALPFAWFMRGALGDPAYTTGLLAWAEALRRIAPNRLRRTPLMSTPAALWLVLVGAALYAPYFGPEPFDLYRHPGVEHPAVCAAILLPAALLSARPMSSFALVFPAALTLALFDLHDSRNLWDLMLDPVLVVFCLLLAISRPALARFRDRRGRTAA